MDGTSLTIGKFDGFHSGHYRLFRDITDIAFERNLKPVIIMICTDEPRIFTPAEEDDFIKRVSQDKVEIIRINFTPEFKAVSAEDFIKDYLVDKYNAKHIAVGDNFYFGKDRKGNPSLLKAEAFKYGFDVNIINIDEEDTLLASSTLIRTSLSKGQMKAADNLLGHMYYISGTVEKGKALGRQLGFPTINIVPDEKKFLPKYGVYSSTIIIDGVGKYNGITNIGVRPSVDDGDRPNVETFIYDFSEDIYGSEVKICPKSFIREEIAFSSIDELKEQIAKDIETAKSK